MIALASALERRRRGVVKVMKCIVIVLLEEIGMYFD